MKRIWIANGILAGLIAAAGASAGVVELRVTEIRVAEGSVMVAVVDSESGFKGQAPPVAQAMLQARAGEIALSIDALPPGHYAIRVFQDLNGNGELDSNLMGLPREPWAFSNDATGRFGPPRWSDARFTLDAESSAVQTIRLNH